MSFKKEYDYMTNIFSMSSVWQREEVNIIVDTPRANDLIFVYLLSNQEKLQERNTKNALTHVVSKISSGNLNMSCLSQVSKAQRLLN